MPPESCKAAEPINSTQEEIWEDFGHKKKHDSMVIHDIDSNLDPSLSLLSAVKPAQTPGTARRVLCVLDKQIEVT